MTPLPPPSPRFGIILWTDEAVDHWPETAWPSPDGPHGDATISTDDSISRSNLEERRQEDVEGTG
eukprot:CAMPEP_0177723556 /NCGR_PEP_ID=MMETSP0484_2-20121128/18272_1 /TAXON_ID=354590 /ORGANISM="Rhodomonas lens, Strain RHODO" /LENGTH=64 /DNA_ID=CAMNT_0019235993 /DNA_START=556 /DNA_END=748 /DNA_ORIENTATION=-